MSLALYMHPFASFCMKVLVALYENDAPFEKIVVDLGDERSRNAFLAVWPAGKFPVLRDSEAPRVIPESTIIIEYLDRKFPGRTRLVPADPDEALRTRLFDRFFDTYVQNPMQKIVGDRLRPANHRDRFGVDEARASLRTAYGILEADIAGKEWAMGDAFTMADCAAAPALHYADLVEPLTPGFPNAAAYLQRLKARPSFARTLDEAQPYFHNFPKEETS
ncbi:MAG: glutathione S-transferase family protein [Polyangiaceae bacterium]|nr:glutathione S-transferase family protein [Polyangiaceae bacterium]